MIDGIPGWLFYVGALFMVASWAGFALVSDHAMLPLDAPLVRGDQKSVYDGSFVPTMAGPWKMTVRVDVAGEEMWAEFPVEALRASAPRDTDGLRYVVELRDPVRANGPASVDRRRREPRAHRRHRSAGARL